MLIADGGPKLRDAFRGRGLLREWERSLVLNAEIQLALLGRERELLATRTPDRRLEWLPSLVAALLDDRTVLRGGAADPLSAGERRRIVAALPVVEARCRELASVGIGASIDHDDLHDGNVLRRGRRTVIFDWGDACVTHPFLCLTIALRTVARHAGVRRGDPRVARLRDVYLEPFGRFGSMAALRRAADLGERLGTITRALSWYRVVTLTGARDEGEETLASWLRLLPRAFPVRRSRAR